MDRNQLFLEALRAHLNTEKIEWDMEISKDQWMDLFDLSEEQKVLPMIYETVYPCLSFKKQEDELKTWVNMKTVYSVCNQVTRTQAFEELYQKLLDIGLTPVVVKGLICRQLYPMPDHRISGDEDLMIPPEQFNKCHEQILMAGLKLDEKRNSLLEELREISETSYTHPINFLHIELHKELFPSESRAYGNLNEALPDFFDHVTKKRIGQVAYLVPDETEHLTYLILHAYKHFLHSGFGIRQVCDIKMFAEHEGARIDWKGMLDILKGVRADCFAASLFAAAEAYLGFDREKAMYPDYWRDLAEDPEELLLDLLEGGVFGSSSLSRVHSSNITLKAVEDDSKGKKAGVPVMYALFPGKAELIQRFPYLEKRPYLLPAAWTQRMVQYIKELASNKHGNNKAISSVKIGTERIALLRKYRIIG